RTHAAPPQLDLRGDLRGIGPLPRPEVDDASRACAEEPGTGFRRVSARLRACAILLRVLPAAGPAASADRRHPHAGDRLLLPDDSGRPVSDLACTHAARSANDMSLQ